MSMLKIAGGFIYNPTTNLYLLVDEGGQRGIKFSTETLKDGETSLEALIRGLNEEAGVTLDINSIVPVFGKEVPGLRGDMIYMHFFYGEVSKLGKPSEVGEVTLNWVTESELRGGYQAIWRAKNKPYFTEPIDALLNYFDKIKL